MPHLEKRFIYEGIDGTPLAGYRWAWPGVRSRAIIQLAHGAAEHASRYLPRLVPLLKSGFIVYTADHRGHGQTAGISHQGDFGEGGAHMCITDMAQLARLARRDHPELPLALFGHSLGAAFAQILVHDHPELVDGLVLSGTAVPTPPPTGGWNTAFTGAATPFDWLSRDRDEVARYEADIFCGHSFNSAAEISLANLRDRRKEVLQSLTESHGFPVYVFAGDDDPVNGKLSMLTPLLEAYGAAGMNVTSKIYPGGRHEMLNETNRDEVLADLISWLHDWVGSSLSESMR